MNSERKAASIIIPTYNRSKLLDLTLKTLANQDVDKSTIEVLIADDGSSDNTMEIVEGHKKHLCIRYFFQEDKGYRVASARNLAIRHAHGEVLIFVDSGILLSPGFVTAHLSSHSKKGKDLAVIGYILGLQLNHPNTLGLDEVDASNTGTIISDLIREQKYLDLREEIYSFCESNIAALPAPWVLFWTGNVSVRKSTLMKVGFFDTNFDSRWGIEDVELGYRMHLNKVGFELNRNASSIHYPHFSDSSQKAAQEFENKRYMHAKHNTQETEALLSSDTVMLNRLLNDRSRKTHH